MCGSPDCCKCIPPHLCYISCFNCDKFYHVRCCNINKKQFDGIKDSGENWLGVKCRPKEMAIRCGSCRKPVQKNNALIQCSLCNKFFTRSALKLLLMNSLVCFHGNALHVVLKFCLSRLLSEKIFVPHCKPKIFHLGTTLPTVLASVFNLFLMILGIIIIIIIVLIMCVI